MQATGLKQVSDREGQKAKSERVTRADLEGPHRPWFWGLGIFSKGSRKPLESLARK